MKAALRTAEDSHLAVFGLSLNGSGFVTGGQQNRGDQSAWLLASRILWL
jgi:hypothetical protein